MNSTHPALLPAGLADMLPPDAGFEARKIEQLVRHFESFGYDRVKPPLIEFEDSLVSGSGAATAAQTFRMMDPISQRMLGVRPDITVQVARIATTRLADVPRPLRLSYAGQVLRIKGSPLRPERQFGQVGAEIIGSEAPDADAEVIVMAAEALASLGVTGLSVDLGTPTLIAVVSDDLGLDTETAHDRLRTALNQKDAASLAEYGSEAVQKFSSLLNAAGPAEAALQSLSKTKLPEAAQAEIEHLAAVVSLVSREAPDLSLTVDPVEIRGYEYHTGITYTYFALDARGELGRGGRYLAENVHPDHPPEPATGISIFLDALLRVLPKPDRQNKVYIPVGTARTVASDLRKEGWIAVNGLSLLTDPGEEARQLGCTHLWFDDGITSLGDATGE